MSDQTNPATDPLNIQRRSTRGKGGAKRTAASPPETRSSKQPTTTRASSRQKKTTSTATAAERSATSTARSRSSRKGPEQRAVLRSSPLPPQDPIEKPRLSRSLLTASQITNKATNNTHHILMGRSLFLVPSLREHSYPEPACSRVFPCSRGAMLEERWLVGDTVFSPYSNSEADRW